MQKKIVIISSGHSPFDERIFHKFGKSLVKHHYDVIICTSTEELKVHKENIIIDSFDGKNMNKKEKINHFISLLKNYMPGLVICCEPLPVLAASAYRRQSADKVIIISDITEWYPPLNYINQLKGFSKIFRYLQMFLFNMYTSNLADHLIFGEENKVSMYRYTAPFKKKTIIGYYPPAEYFQNYKQVYKDDNIALCYTGLFTEKRGFKRFINAGISAANKRPDILFTLLTIGRYVDNNLQDYIDKSELPSNLQVKQKGWAGYDEFNKLISESNICIDLRDADGIYNKSLPIKIFDYMATGRPVIFSDLSSLVHIPELDQFGFLVDPDDNERIVKIIEYYIDNPSILMEHSVNARKLFEEKYNWSIPERELLKLVDNYTSG